jgi:hypothetical protein
MDINPYLGRKRRKYDNSNYSKLYNPYSRSHSRKYTHNKRKNSEQSISSNSYHHHYYVLINI